MYSRRKKAGSLAILACAAMVAGMAPSVASADTSPAAPAAQPPATGGGAAATLTFTEATQLFLDVSPNRRQIAMGFLDNLYILPATGGTAKRVSSYSQGVEYPTWSPNGKTIAFNSFKTGTYHIWSMSPNGSHLRQLTNTLYDDREPQFSPNGKMIAFSSDRPPAGSAAGVPSGVYNVWTLNLSTGKVHQVTHATPAQSDYYPTWTPNGKSITFVNTGHEIDSVAANGSDPTTTLYKDPSATLYSPTWSPNGRKLAYTESVTGPATRLMINGKAVSASNEDVFTFPARWLSNNTVIYGGNGHIQKRNLAAGTVATIPFAAKVSYNRPSYNMKQYNFESTASQQVRGIVAPELSPNGRDVAFVALNQVYLMPIGGKPHALTSGPYYKGNPTWSPDGRYLAYSSDKDGAEAIYIRDMQTGQVRKLTAPFKGAQTEMAWSPDGKKIAFQTDLNQDIYVNTYVADVATGQIKLVQQNNFEPGRPSWGPDSNVLAISEYRAYSNRGGGLYGAGSNEIYTINVTTGQTHWYDPYPFDSQSIRVLDDGPVWSPNGRYMAYILQDVLWVVPVNRIGAPTGKPRQVTKETADQISWSGNSQHLLYNHNGTLRLVSVNGGRPRTVPVDLTWRQAVPGGSTVIHAGWLWAGTNGSLQPNVDIVVEGNKISSVGPAQPRSSYPGNVKYVDASKLTVIPGMWDAHVHEEMDQPYAGGRKDRLMLSLGITSIMSMGDPAYSALEEVESQQSGLRPGPRYFWDAEPIDGRRVYWNWMRATPNQTTLNRTLSRIAALKPDALKTYVRLPVQYEKEAYDEAHKLGIPGYSHFFWPALQVGQDGTSHQVPERRGYKLAFDSNNISYNDVNQLYATSGMSDTDNPFGQGAADFYPKLPNDPRMKALLSPWQYNTAVQLYANGPMSPSTITGQERRSQSFMTILGEGGTILTGTDAPLGVGDYGDVVGISTMANTGMSNYQALRAATVEPAQTMGLSSQLGTIQPGMIADMDVIKGNPLQDINAISNEVYVMQNGTLYTEKDLIGPYAKTYTPKSQTAYLTAQLDGVNEPGGGDPTATGYAVITANRLTGKVCTTITSDIANPTMMHIHAGSPGSSGPVVLPLNASTINHGQSCTTVSPTLASQIIAQGTFGTGPVPFYVNIHTAAYPNGAIRGQLTNSPPIPASSQPLPPAPSDVHLVKAEPGKAEVAYYPQVYPYDHNTVTATDLTNPKAPVITVNTESNSAWLTGLTGGDVYQVTVTTTSSAGTSAPSKPLILHAAT